nr:MFS transporter [uncultured Carboxylicivirga sp.]
MSEIGKTIKSFPKLFWVANTIELFERFAWYGFFMLFANYLTSSTDAGGLELSQAQKGIIMGVGTGILYFLPIITGSIADKFGYRKVLFIAFIVYTSAFIAMPHFKTFTGVFFIYLYLALGAALFKPIISATVAKTTNDSNASIGFGIFYLMVNFGAFFGPLVTLLVKNSSYTLVFYISAGIVALNFFLLLFYKEPEKEDNDEPLAKSLARIFKNILTVLLDFKFVLFLLIVAGFWTMYNQLFFTLPVFIKQWVDTSSVFDFFAHYAPFFSHHYGLENGQMEAEFITNFDAMFIIIFQVIVSAIVMKWRPLKTMMTGFLVCSIGMALTLTTQNVLFTLVAIYIFAIGEMAGSPKITEYIGRIAPPDKKALYMGYSFIPVFIGNVFAGIISGNVYQITSDKTQFIHQEIAERGLSLPDGLTQDEYFSAAANKLNMTTSDLTNFLWDKYDPASIWKILLAIGLFAVVALYFYDKSLNKAKSK